MAGVWDDWARLTRYLDVHQRILTPDPTDGDEELLFGSVLIHSYALAESAVGEHLGRSWRNLGPIEHWGERLLAAQEKRWEHVSGALPGVVEVVVIRNIYAHGGRTLDADSVARLERVGVEGRKVGEPVTLTYPSLRKYRGRLQSLLHHGGLD